MALRKITLQARPEHAKMRLDQFLADRLPELLGRPVSKAKVRQLVVAGAVYLNGRRVRIASKELIPGAKVEALVDEKKLFADAASRERPFEMKPARVLYEDEWLIAVDKPAGLPTQPTLDEARVNLFASVKKFLSQREGVAQPYLGLHHRLDRDTSGVILFTKSREANAGVGELFSKHLAQKTYHALAQKPRKSPWGQDLAWVVRNHLGKAPGSGKRARFTAVRSGGDFAETSFRLLEEAPGCLLVEAMPKTGRTHQIRVHLGEEEMPILGDTLYGARLSGPAQRVMLHAVNLTFPHPVHHNQISIHCPLPEDFLKCLQSCRDPRATSERRELS